MARPILYPLIITLCIQNLFTGAAAAQAEEQPTPDETRAVHALVDQFVNRLQETGEIATVMDELFVSDFATRYVNEQRKRVADHPQWYPQIYFAPGLTYLPRLLDEASTNDWRRLSIATHNLVYYGFLIGMNHFAKDLLKGEEPDLESLENLENIYPSNLVEFLKDDPILKDFILAEGAPNPIGNAADMRRVAEKLEQALALLKRGGEPWPPRLTGDGKEALALMRKAFRKGLPPQVIEGEVFGYLPADRIFVVQTPMIFKLYAINNHGEYQIVWADAIMD